ncbi:putative NADH-ubiquinone oxidoreductase 29.9 kDa subunit [Seiridium cardinale]|uniref:NADH-ubiquinone oxidoreductase 29.9 kDa subunit n=1 Tax=Seiridium cardinale TaxID=138064 RepID=A0ABR2XBW3_9PEZI
MRRTLRLFASVKPARYLEAGAPTGLTGVYTHNSPRSTLLYLYSTTLDKLKTTPESSVYRQSIEALTKHRMAIVAAAQPPGYTEWQQHAQKILKENPEGFNIAHEAAIDGAQAQIITKGDQTFLLRHDPERQDDRYEEWDGEVDEGGEREGLRPEAERKDQELIFSRQPLEIKQNQVQWTPEPQLTAAQVEEIENKIGGGLIEEVVQMAESELKLVDFMLQAKPWEELEEKPAEGQWTYFERNSA